METKAVIENLEREWDFDTGFFGQLRRGKFDAASLNRLIQILDFIDFGDNHSVNRRVVALLWYMPLFMEWQKKRVQEAGGNVEVFDKATNQVQHLVEKLLGVP